MPVSRTSPRKLRQVIATPRDPVAPPFSVEVLKHRNACLASVRNGWPTTGRQMCPMHTSSR